MTTLSFVGSEVAELLPTRLKFKVDGIQSRDFEEPKSLTGQALGLVRTMVMEEISASFDTEETGSAIIDAISGVWARLIVLREYADPDIHPPGITETVYLSEHELPLSAEIIVELDLKNIGAIEVVFDLRLTFGIKGAALYINSGKIMAISLGEIEGIVTITLEDMQLHSFQPLKPLDLGGRIEFVNGIQLG